jgi:sigma-E factor negative regulatory protein RseB
VTPLALLPRAWTVAALALAAGVTGIVAPGASSAAVPRVPFEPLVSDQRAVDLLQAAYVAGRRLSYAGTAFVGLGSTYLKVRLRHVPGQGTYVQPDDGMSAHPTTTLQPDAVGRSAGSPLAMLRANYQLLVGAVGTVAGRPVVQIRAKRADGALAATFSVDQRTGLVLARSAYDPSGHRYEQVEFTDVTVQPPSMTTFSDGAVGNGVVVPSHPGVFGSMVSPQHTVVTADDGVGALRAAGWHIDQQLPGGFELYDARLTGSGRTAVLHLSYSDGLTSLSVFEERGRLRAAPLAGWQAVRLPAPAAGRTVYADGSSPQRLAWQGGETVYALLTDAAPARVAAVVASLPYGEPSAGLLDRMRRGFDRLGSWVDPFN